MKLIKDLESFTIKDIGNLITCIESRLEYEEDREPESDGAIWDDWNQRVSDLTEIINYLESSEEYPEDFGEAIVLIKLYQEVHGGLSRLTVGE